MTNGFGRPAASRIAPRRNPSVAPAPATGDSAPAAENEPTLLDDTQATAKPTPSPEPATSKGENSSPAATGPAADATPPADEPAPATTTPVEPETPQEAPSEPKAATDGATDGASDEDPGPSSTPAKPRKQRKTRSAPAGDKAGNTTAGGASLVVIGPDGDIAVDDSVHVVDLRTVATETDPHTLVDQLSALANVADSTVRADAAAAISEAITKVALAS